MATTNLTARGLRSLKAQPTRVDWWDENLSGFGVRIAPSGRKTFIVFYRYQRRLRRLSLGVYPRMSLAIARERARAALRELDNGIDPAATKHAVLRAETFGDLANLYIERHAKRRKRSWKDDERMINRELLSSWKHLRAADITRHDVRMLLETVADRPAPILANRLLALVRKMFNFGVSRDLLGTNPCWQLERPSKEQPRDRVLTEEEIRGVGLALDAEAAAGRSAIATYFWLRLLTAQRGQEVAGMRWQELDAASRMWTIPGERSKNGLAHRVPLSPYVWEMLERLRAIAEADRDRINVGRAIKSWQPLELSQYLFPSPRRAKADRPWGRNLQNAIDRIRKQSGVYDWTGHDLRRTAASHMTASGVPRLTVAKILNHVERTVTAVYDRYGYDAEKRAALEGWSRTVQGILDGNMAVVLPLRRTS